MRGKGLGLIAWLAVCFVAAAIGAWASVDAASFYTQLTQPAWAPPPTVFGPVWGVLYTMMAIAAWLVWLRGGFGAQRRALGLFLVQLAINAIWSWLFFKWHLGAVALADIALLWIALVATIVAFARARPLAAVLLIPYLLWASFAAALNFSVWQLNPSVL